MKVAQRTGPKTAGIALHSASSYDLLVWLITLGRSHIFRERMLRPARLKPGESVLDVGCGTGSLAIAAKQQIGPTGSVYGLDASPEMVARAKKKAQKTGAEVVFKQAFAQSLPFPESQFDVVLSTMMLHHLPAQARQELAGEILRVLEPGGRVLVIDFGEPARKRPFLDFLHHRRGHVELKNIIALLTDAGLKIIESGDVGMLGLQFVIAKAQGKDDQVWQTTVSNHDA